MEQRKSPTELYHQDFDLWIKAQVASLRAGHLSAVDVANVTEELEALAKRDRRKIKSKLRQIETHLLKQQHQSEKATLSWQVSIAKERAAIHDVLEDSPSMRGELDGWIEDVYPAAREQARLETGLGRSDFRAEPSPDFLNALGRVLRIRPGVFTLGEEPGLRPEDTAGSHPGEPDDL